MKIKSLASLVCAITLLVPSEVQETSRQESRVEFQSSYLEKNSYLVNERKFIEEYGNRPGIARELLYVANLR